MDSTKNSIYYHKYRKYKKKCQQLEKLESAEQSLTQLGGEFKESLAVQADYDTLDWSVEKGLRYNIIKFDFIEGSGQALNAPHASVILANKKIKGLHTRIGIGKGMEYLSRLAKGTSLPTKLLYVEKTDGDPSGNKLQLQLHHNQPDDKHALHRTNIEKIKLLPSEKVYIRNRSDVIAYTYSINFVTGTKLTHLRGFMSKFFQLRDGVQKPGYLWVNNQSAYRKQEIAAGEECYLNKHNFVFCILKSEHIPDGDKKVQGGIDFRKLDFRPSKMLNMTSIFENNDYPIIYGPATVYIQDHPLTQDEVKLQRFNFNVEEGTGILESLRKKKKLEGFFHHESSSRESDD